MLRYFLASSGEDIHAGFPSGKSAADSPDSKKPPTVPLATENLGRGKPPQKPPTVKNLRREKLCLEKQARMTTDDTSPFSKKITGEKKPRRLSRRE
jgi:hypothetical protein